jgi:hypothetical protein
VLYLASISDIIGVWLPLNSRATLLDKQPALLRPPFGR